MKLHKMLESKNWLINKLIKSHFYKCTDILYFTQTTICCWCTENLKFLPIYTAEISNLGILTETLQAAFIIPTLSLVVHLSFVVALAYKLGRWAKKGNFCWMFLWKNKKTKQSYSISLLISMKIKIKHNSSKKYFKVFCAKIFFHKNY